uniref:DUF4349 domain-containing protein n=1 Tax=Thermosporothrix sp. COM3 TaxID=2490863 RepID=A0A455SZ71_9CHLR|nr:hypothetical protein KTC_61660 [Thermosporothrix sp. COM3]
MKKIRLPKTRKARVLYGIGGSLLILILLVIAINTINHLSRGRTIQSTILPSSIQTDSSTGKPTLTNTNGKNAMPPSKEQTDTPSTTTPQQLIKSLNVSMEFQDPTKTAKELEHWIMQTDPKASSEGIQYQRSYTSAYVITMTFSVQANIYPQVRAYLTDYAKQHQGQLLSLQEAIQDVTDSTIDLKSRIKNLEVERDRLNTLMKQATEMADILAIEEKLSTVETDIERYQTQLDSLSKQTTMYPVTITLSPLNTTVPTTPDTPSWNIGEVFAEAWSASLEFAQTLISIVIWLLAFSIYLIPLALIVWLIRMFQKKRVQTIAPKIATTAPVEPHTFEPAEPDNEKQPAELTK